MSEDERADGGEDETAAHELFAPGPPTESVAAPVAADPSSTDPIVGRPSDDVDEDEDEDEEDERKGLSFGSKALIVLAAWILLVVFFVGQFSGDDDPIGPDPVNLNQAGGTTVVGEDGTSADETPVEEPVDVDGDGEIEEGEPGFATASNVPGASAAGSTSGGATGSSGGSSGSGTSGSTGGTTGEGGRVPVTPGGSTTTTKKPSAGGSTTTTSQQGGGGGSSTTTAPTTTTTEEDIPDPVVVTIDRGSGSEFSTPTATLVRGQAIRFINADTNTNHELDVPGPNLNIPKGEQRLYTFANAGVFVIECTINGHEGSLTVTVS